MDQSKIRNFSIIAHIDHGKSTLADRILEMTDTVHERDMMAQILDTLDLERERGITIKLNAVQLLYKALDGETYTFHLIDTPGHVDFTYEVSRSLAACEGAVLVVDAAQGIEAQTLANVYLALDNNLEILPVINKVDLPAAQPEVVRHEIENIIGLDASEAPLISAKSGLNVQDVLEQIVKYVPAPKGNPNGPLKALVFDSIYDTYRGVICYVRIKEGSVKVGDSIHFMATGATYLVTELGVRTPKEVKKDRLDCGEVGWIAASIKSVKDVHVGDTITLSTDPAIEPLPGYRILNSMVFCGLYPVDANRYNDLREALEKLQLNDASLKYEAETSQALGFGFRCGFLGLLHMDVVQERLEREYNLTLIATAPSVVYHVYLTDGTMVVVDNPALLPDVQRIEHMEEPYVKATIMVPK
ncbi:MAG: elongation factor 4, partial [Erysipelotrichaceae bacterium]|nr:elongation factor 4 [Erysipelotrichaceae bacterium]